MRQDISMRQAAKGTTPWPNLLVQRPVFVEGVVTFDIIGGRQSYFQLETCGWDLVKS